MLRRLSMAVLGSLVALMAAPIWTVSAQTDTSPNTIHVLVYQDVNDNEEFDDSDVAVAGVEVFAGSAAAEFTAVSDAEGWASLPASAGEWSVSIQTPEGFELISTEPNLVVFDQSGDQEQIVHIGLRQTSLSESEPEPGPEDSFTPTVEPEVTVTEAVDPDEGQTGDAGDPDDLPVLLPESGASIPPFLLAGLGAGAVMLFGLGLITAGRRLQR